MQYNEYLEILSKNNLHIHKDGVIYKHGKNNKNRPIANNEVFQDLSIKRQQGNITYRENELLGNCVMTIVRICLNNGKFRYQDENIKNEIKTEAYMDIFNAIDSNLYNPSKGKAYSYFFRLAYVAGIHVLERYNKKAEFDLKLIEIYEKYMNSDGGKVITTTNFI